MTSFLDKLTAAIRRNDSLLCLGLDPEISKFPAELLQGASEEERLVAWCTGLIEQTAGFVCCIKPNIAFFEQYGLPGLNALKRILAAVPADIPVLLDAKRGDIGSTAAAYAKACFEFWDADAVTLSPYLGKDSVEPFLAYPGKAIFLLCQTSNPSAGEIQGHGEEPLISTWLARHRPGAAPNRSPLWSAPPGRNRWRLCAPSPRRIGSWPPALVHRAATCPHPCRPGCARMAWA